MIGLYYFFAELGHLRCEADRQRYDAQAQGPIVPILNEVHDRCLIHPESCPSRVKLESYVVTLWRVIRSGKVVTIENLRKIDRCECLALSAQRLQINIRYFFQRPLPR
jgi:hypothetical protein